MSKTTQYDAEDNIVGGTVSTNTITVQFSRKVGRENYGNEEAGLFFQVDVEEGDDMATIEEKIKSTYTFAKTLVLNELGLESTTDESGIVRDVPQAQAAKPAPRKAGGARKASGGGGSAPSADKVSAWQDLIDNPTNWWDNRPKKAKGDYSPKAPDFKGKADTDFADTPLWIKDKDLPAFARLWLDGQAEAA